MRLGGMTGLCPDSDSPGVSMIKHPALKESDAEGMAEVYMAIIPQHHRCKLEKETDIKIHLPNIPVCKLFRL